VRPPPPITPLNSDQVRHLERFLGYGRLDAPVWFVGMEEGGGGPENIRARLQFAEVEDCANAHRRLDLLKYHRAERPVIQRTWGQMARFMLHLQGREIGTDDVRAYQANQLGRSGGRSMLLELMPIPKPSLKHSSAYEGLLPQYADADYREGVRRTRIRLLQQLVERHRPQVVVCYGKAYWEHFASLFPGLRFRSGTSGGVAKPYQWGRRGEQVVVLAHHLVAPSMNGWATRTAAHVRTLVPAATIARW